VGYPYRYWRGAACRPVCGPPPRGVGCRRWPVGRPFAPAWSAGILHSRLFPGAGCGSAEVPWLWRVSAGCSHVGVVTGGTCRSRCLGRPAVPVLPCSVPWSGPRLGWPCPDRLARGADCYRWPLGWPTPLGCGAARAGSQSRLGPVWPAGVLAAPRCRGVRRPCRWRAQCLAGGRVVGPASDTMGGGLWPMPRVGHRAWRWAGARFP